MHTQFLILTVNHNNKIPFMFLLLIENILQPKRQIKFKDIQITNNLIYIKLQNTKFIYL